MNPKMLLDRYEVSPRKSLGQNFLHDPNALEKIVAVAEVSRDDQVLEIGPGTGALTEWLVQAARRVVAVEIDTRLQPILQARFAGVRNVEFVYEDILASYLPGLMRNEPYLVVANVPYYITSAILKHVLEVEPRPRRVVMTVQWEVAARITAKPGDMSLLAVSVQYYAKTTIGARFNPAVFYPRPEVDSAVIRLDVYDKPPVDAPSEKLFFRMARAGFSQKRKQLRNSMAGGLSMTTEATVSLIERAGIDPRRRAETLTLAEWASLARTYAADMPDAANADAPIVVDDE